LTGRDDDVLVTRSGAAQDAHGNGNYGRESEREKKDRDVGERVYIYIQQYVRTTTHPPTHRRTGKEDTATRRDCDLCIRFPGCRRHGGARPAAAAAVPEA